MRLLRTYGFSLLLLLGIGAGVAIGRLSPATAKAVRPLGDLFLNLIFMLIVPLVFFTVSSSIAASGDTKRLSRVSARMLVVFLGTSLVAAVTGLIFMLVVQPRPGAGIVLTVPPPQEMPGLLAQIVRTFTVPDFPELITRKAMLPLIVFSAAVGIATLKSGEKGADLARVLASGTAVFVRLIGYVMYVAPVGLAAFFAATIVDTGEQLASAYLGVFVAYHVFAALYFLVGFSAYAYLAGRMAAVRRFWANMLKPSLTALGTCSSMATMPVNLDAAPRMGVPPAIGAVVLPVGAAVHKDGSVIGGVLKCLFAMSLFHVDMSPGRLLAVVGVAILVGVVVGAIPSGGMMGELLVLSVFGFPTEALPLLAIIAVVIDPVATLLNATGDNVAAMLVTRWEEGDVWRSGAAPGAPDGAAPDGGAASATA